MSAAAPNEEAPQATPPPAPRRVSRAASTALAAVLIVALIVLVASGGGDDEPDATADAGPSATQDATLRIGLGEAPENLNPIFGDQYGTIYGDKWQFFNGLVGRDKNLELVPELAASMPVVSDGGRTITVKLREGVKFHDGSEMTADDVVYTYESILDPDVATGIDDELFDTPKLEGVKGIDRYTAQFTLADVDPDFVGKLDLGIVPKLDVSGKALNTASFNKKPIGTGPYRFVELRPDRMIMEANSDYFAGAVGVRRVIYSFVPDENARAAQMAAGKLDVEAASLTPQLAKRCCSREGSRNVAVPGDAFVVKLPQQNPLFEDADVRRAISHGIDRDRLVSGVLGGAGAVAFSPFGPGTPFYDASVEVPFDRDSSKRLLADAGYRDSDGDGIVERGDRALRFELAYGHGGVTDRLALALRSDLRKIGIDARLKAGSFDAQQDHLRKGGALIDAIAYAYSPGRDGIRRIFGRAGLDDDDVGTNPTQLRDPAVFAALRDGSSTTDQDERAEAYGRFQQALVEDSSWIGLMRQQHVFTVSDKVRGVDPQVAEGHLHSYGRALLWNLSQWTIAQPSAQ